MSRREIVAGRVQKFSGNQIIVRVTWSDDGAPLLDVREFFTKDGEWTPMKAGFTVGIQRARAIAAAIERAAQIAEAKHASA